MLEKIRKLFNADELLSGNYGIEREALRVDYNGLLAQSKHPEVFGDKNVNPYITTDFSESQIEVITPVFNNVEDIYSFSNALYDIVCGELKDEYLWPQSMPCIINSDKEIRVAEYSDDNDGKAAQRYRENLMKKYGGRKQLICGIHFNFSFNDNFINKLYEASKNKYSYKEFKNNLYLKVARNYIRYRWLIIYLTGSTPVLHETFISECIDERKDTEKCRNICCDTALSYRNGKCGYKNKMDLYPDYTSVNEYIKSINNFISDKIIENHKELYSSVRLKTKDAKNLLKSLEEDGIDYLEYRSIDINPFEKGGISLEDLKMLQLFNLYFLIKEESSYELWQEEALKNTFKISENGLKDVSLNKDGVNITKNEYALLILDEIQKMNNELNLKMDDIINIMKVRIENPCKTYSYKFCKMIKEEGYVKGNIKLAEKYKKEAYKDRFKFSGYEDMELSTQIIMKESIKRGIKVNVVDRTENFISLKQKDTVEYVKQATKTSKDNYVSVLMMENKSVTKKVLNDNNIRVPQGEEIKSMDEISIIIKKYIQKPIVIKPKSTNFGTGISIFKDGAEESEIAEALKIAFKYDNTVLIEEFIKGREYRFLVINDKVCGILHRVPANVTGDGIKTIRELVDIKNQDTLRGYHYVTPLEKIKLDENAKLFLKNNNKDFDYVPEKDEIVYLRENSNISTGGDSIDYTDKIPEKFKDIAVKCAKAVNAKICGVDMMIEDYSDENSNYGIIELNFNPAIHIHCYPYSGKERNIAKEVLKLLEFNI